MKKIASYFYALAALLIASAAFISCVDNVVEEPTSGNGSFTMTVTATKDAPTKALTPIGTTLTASWTKNDEVLVYNGAAHIGTLYAQSTGATTELKGNITTTPSEGATLMLKYLSPTYSGQDGTLDYIATHCDYATASVTVASVANNIITTTEIATFVNQQAIVKFSLADKADVTGNTKLSPSVLNATVSYMTVAMSNYSFIIPDATYTKNGEGILYFAIPSDIPSSIDVPGVGTTPVDVNDITIALTATVGSETYNYSKSSFPFENGKYYEITVKMRPEGTVNGLFTVNGSGKKVYFSKGNLQYYCSTSAPEWKFAEHQYDYIAYDNSAYSENSEKWIDLFAYGTSGYDNGQTNYQPWKICASGSWYSSNLSGNADWGYNKISNGGNTENSGWRTLTNAEWQYLFQSRTNAASKYGFGSINGTNGIILLPDSWTLPGGLSFTPGTSAWTNSYTTVEWAMMDNAGAVFLPASGSCNATAVPPESTQNAHGFYRSSTYAYYMHFTSNTMDYGSFPQYGDAVRLVRNVNQSE